MILVDTSVWIDHLRRGEARLSALLEGDRVGSHPVVIEELALGTLRDRVTVLGSLGQLRRFPVMGHAEVLGFVEGRRLWGRGLSVGDVHLLGSALLEDGAHLWTRDKRLRAAAAEIGVDLVDWH